MVNMHVGTAVGRTRAAARTYRLRTHYTVGVHSLLFAFQCGHNCRVAAEHHQLLHPKIQSHLQVTIRNPSSSQLRNTCGVHARTCQAGFTRL